MKLPKKLILKIFIFSALLISYLPKESYAIPAFARKYQVSCMQCHITILRRNEFGDAFRRNGYQWIDGIDDTASVEKYIPLKGNAHETGGIPGIFPVAVYGHQRIKFSSSGAKKDKAEFDAHELELVTAGTLGKDISFLGEWIIWEHGVSGDDRLGELWLMFDNLYGRGLNIKMGKMAQTLSLYKENDRQTLNHYITNTYTVKDFETGGKRAGVEANGIIKDRFDYAIGIGDNNNNWNDENYKDFYYHIGWKPFGMTFTGHDPHVDLDNPSFSDFLIVTLAHYGYLGTESDFNASGGVNYTNRIKRFGFDATVEYRDITFLNSFVLGRDDNPTNANEKASSYTFFNEVNYRLKPWLSLVYRYEHADNKLSGGGVQNKHIPALLYLLRGNIRFSLEGLITDDHQDNESLTFNILFAF